MTERVTVVPHEPELAPEVAGARGLRTGFATGTCAAAAAKAAVQWLVDGVAPAEVDIALPGGRRVRFPVSDVDPRVPHRCAVVKDAGDDPDVTHGAHLTVHAEWDPAAVHGSVTIRRGEGVGLVTQPGLGLPVGSPAVNPVPRRMIETAVAEVTGRPVALTVSVPGGETMAAGTSNARLGIVGGISILGTTGIVRPFSTAAWRAAVVQQLDVAAANGHRRVALTTGSRTSTAARRLCPDLPDVCLVEVGDFTGPALRRAAERNVADVVFVGMAGKIAKLAAGVMMTHYRRSVVDTPLLASIASECGAPGDVVAAARSTATARAVVDACVATGHRVMLDELCRRAAAMCRAHVGHRLSVQIVMVDFDGARVLARG